MKDADHQDPTLGLAVEDGVLTFQRAEIAGDVDVAAAPLRLLGESPKRSEEGVEIRLRLRVAPAPRREVRDVEEVCAGTPQQPKRGHRSAGAPRAELVEDSFEGRVFGYAAGLTLLERSAEGLATLLL